MIGTSPPLLGQTVSPGEKLTLRIQDLAFGGEGVARAGDFVTFVPYVLPGEEVEVEIIEVKKRFARARLLKLITPSPDRVTAPCPYFGSCGGCQYQHLAYPLQLQSKRNQIQELMRRIGNIDPALVQEVIPAPKPYGYRNRIMIRSQWDKFKQGLNIGFLRYDNRLVIDIEECLIASPGLNELLRRTRQKPPPKGGIKVLLREKTPGWDVPEDSFFQINPSLLPKLVSTIENALLASGARFLIDAYCGVGFFSLELGHLVERFAGIELDARAIDAARRNLNHRGALHGEFISGKTEELLPVVLQRYPPSQTAVILDPPRKGCPSQTLSLLAAAGVGQIIYVSCQPATLARDLKILSESQIYKVHSITPLDMFPQTQHVECVADLRSSGRNMLDQL